jgi:hypothetical protein
MEPERPPHLETSDGQPRHFGFELEYTGVDIQQTCQLVQAAYGGRIEPVNRFLSRVVDTGVGEFTIELDSSLLKERWYEGWLSKLGFEFDEKDRGELEKVLAQVASWAIPYELVTPPLRFEDMASLEQIANDLRRHKARGARAMPHYAFGFQINAEAPALDADSLRAFMQAFLVLYPWLREVTDVVLSRRISPFVDEFPRSYRKLVLQDDYEPDREQFMADYMQHNPTRNRPVDLLPLFAHLDKQFVLDRVREGERHLVKPRPAYHYRLPNCNIDDPAWSPALEWKRWLEVEKLADDRSRLDEMRREFNRHDENDIDRILDWLEEWLGL